MLRLVLHPIPTKPGVYEALLGEGVDPDEMLEARWHKSTIVPRAQADARVGSRLEPRRG
jgi:hypothetical protein